MALPDFTMRQLLEAGVHFGHVTRRWNPKMEPYVFGVRNKVHIIDLQQTAPLLRQALAAVRQVVAGGGRVLFVGTKRQASELIAGCAKRCGQYYVNHRWLGGMLTNWKTISNSIRRLRQLDEALTEQEAVGLTKKELLGLTRERNKLERALGGIKEMGGLPDILVVIDTNKEEIAVREANKLGIPIVAVIDSNSDPAGINYPIPGNDDSLRAIALYCDLVSDSVLDGLQEELRASGVDVGEAEAPPTERLDAPAEAAAGEVDGVTDPAPDAAADAAPAEADAPSAEAPSGAEEAAPAEAEAAARAEETAPAEAEEAPRTEEAAPAEAEEAPRTEEAAPAEAEAAPRAEEAAPAEAEEAPRAAPDKAS